MTTPTRYLPPGRVDRLVSSSIATLTRMGLGVAGSRVLVVRGRRSGQPRQTVVNLLSYEGQRYLVAARGETQWVRNLRAAGHGQLRLGRRVQPLTARELTDTAKPPVLRAYLTRWAFEVGRFFDGVDADATDPELLRIAGNHPIFQITLDGAGAPSTTRATNPTGTTEN
jgi:deazaflavin-dependent oxidoreductase (nitroreductase family)